MMFVLTTEDLDLIGKLEAELDPAVFWADSPFREMVPADEWKMVCEEERAILKRDIRWAVVFRDMARLNREFGARETNPEPFREAFYAITDDGHRGPMETERLERFHDYIRDNIHEEHLGLGAFHTTPKTDAWDALYNPSPSSVAYERILGGLLTGPVSDWDDSGNPSPTPRRSSIWQRMRAAVSRSKRKDRPMSRLIAALLAGVVVGAGLLSIPVQASKPDDFEKRLARVERKVSKVDDRTRNYSPIQFTCPGRPGPTPGSVELRELEVVAFGFYCKPFAD
ncbi:MAG: hypothetical protein GEU71_17685 [Actinobacteria bacterium]|nr:hypothetical protein [Actinomycetota bacterium]